MLLLPRKRKAFTLVEILIVVFIIAVLLSIATASFTQAQVAGRNGKRAADLQQLATALELYYQDHGFYPGTNHEGACTLPACPESMVSGDSAECLLGDPVASTQVVPGSWIYRAWYCTYNQILPGNFAIPGPYKTYLPKIPLDPKYNVTYSYASDQQTFILVTRGYEGTAPAENRFSSANRYWGSFNCWMGCGVTGLGGGVWSNQYMLTSENN